MKFAVEPLLIAIGCSALAIVAIVRIDSAVGEQRARAELEVQLESQPLAAQIVPIGRSPDTSEWSEGRRNAWQESQTQQAGTPLGLLTIDSIGLDVAVLAGTDEITLNRGVGTIEGTRIETNLGISGHRDGFFRSLRNIAPGDRIRLETPGAVHDYEVVELMVVSPDQVHVLDPTAEPTLTLVTCFPFFWLGPAPDRFIVRAIRVPSPDAVEITRGPAAGRMRASIATGDRSPRFDPEASD